MVQGIDIAKFLDRHTDSNMEELYLQGKENEKKEKLHAENTIKNFKKLVERIDKTFK